MEIRCSYCKSKMSSQSEKCPRCDTPRGANPEPEVAGAHTPVPVWMWIVGIPVGFVLVVFLGSLFHVVTETPEQREADRQEDIQRAADRYMEDVRNADAETARNAQIAYEVFKRQHGYAH
jgi:hypothetical protein